MYRPKYAMFFDMHTMQKCPDVGHDFDAEKFADHLQNAGVDLVGFHAKCNQGFCYYDTAIGCRHPSMPEDLDMFGEVIKACNKRNIQVSAYLNCGLSNEDGVRHPEWCRMKKDGTILTPEIYNIGWVTPYMRTMCPNSPWRDYLLSLIKEVKDKYPVAGFLFDSFNIFKCYCPHCQEGMKKLGMDIENEDDVNKFAEMSIRKLADDISALIEPKKNGLLAFFLGISTLHNTEIGSYLECECIPTNPVWGYDMLPLKCRWLRKLTDGPVLNMTGRFNTWGDFGSLRPQAAVEYDLLLGLINGMRPNIGDHFPPSGRLSDAIFQRVGAIYKNLQRYDKWFDDAENKVDIAVIAPDGANKCPTLTGLTRMLSEFQAQFEFLDRSCSFDGYKVLLLPDDVILDDEMAAKIEKHLKNGGKIIATGKSGLNSAEEKFVFEKEWGVKYLGKCEYDPAYFTLNEKFKGRAADIPLATYTTGFDVECLANSDAAGQLVAPYYNKHWDGVYSYFYAPPYKKTDRPFLVLSEKCAYCAFPLCESYYTQASPDLREVLKIMVEHVIEKPLLECDKNLPSFGRAFVSDKDDMRIVHLLNYVPDLRGESLMVEEPITATDVGIKLRLDGKKISRIYIAPDQQELPFEIKDDIARFTVPEFKGYAMIVAE